MLVVNLFGAPGAGKSTGAAYIFSKLKMAGVNAELVTEFAKDKVWEESKAAFQNQAYIFGQQYFRISRVQNKVDVVITDSPILLSSFYADDEVLGKEFDTLVTNVSNSYDSMNVFINRVTPYNPSGRFQTEEESDMISDIMRIFLDNHGVIYEQYDGCIAGYDALVNDIMTMIECPSRSYGTKFSKDWSNNHD